MVERNLAKVEVAGSSPVIRLKQYRKVLLFVLPFLYFVGGESGVQPDFLIYISTAWRAVFSFIVRLREEKTYVFSISFSLLRGGRTRGSVATLLSITPTRGFSTLRTPSAAGAYP